MSTIVRHFYSALNGLNNLRITRPYLFYPTVAVAGTGVLTCFAFILLIVLVSYGAFGPMPDDNELRGFRNEVASLAYDRNGETIGRFYRQDRTNYAFDSLPAYLIEALVATEDSRFYTHRGIDYPAYGRVFFKTLLSGDEDQGGGSTLSQQIIKNAYGRPPLGYGHKPDLGLYKVREAILARRLERIMNKEEVLERYLNTVSFPGNTYGIAVAAQRYFQKTPAQLTEREAIALVASLKGTTTYDPRRNPLRNAERCNVIMNRMVAEGYLSAEERKRILSDTLRINYRREAPTREVAPYFTAATRKEAAKILAGIVSPSGKPYDLLADNLRIFTTVDLRVQRHAEAALISGLKDHQKKFERHIGNGDPWQTTLTLWSAIRNSERWRRGIKEGLDSTTLMLQFKVPVAMELRVPNAPPLEGEFTPVDSIRHYLTYLRAGFVALDHHSGAVISWVGGSDFNFTNYDHVTGMRQTGSTYKPFVYAAAIQEGYDPCYRLNNDLISYGDKEGTWTPRNSTGEYGGKYSMHGAMSQSINTAAVRMILKTGAEPVAALAAKMGVLPEEEAVPSIALGTGSATLLAMTGAYGTFANLGNFTAPYFIERIETADGQLVYQHEATPQAVLTEDEAGLMLGMLRRVVDSGTGGRLRWQYGVNIPAAGKTGTTQNMADGWFVGSTPGLTAGAWVGGDSNGVRFRSGSEGNGSHSALPIWADFIKRVEKDESVRKYLGTDFPAVSDKVRTAFYCPDYYPDEEQMAIDSAGVETMTLSR